MSFQQTDAKVRVVLVDDHAVVRRGLAALLRQEENISVVGEAGDGDEGVELVCEVRPDVVLMDVTMPRVSGMEATRRIKREMPQVRVIGLSMHDTEVVGQKMLEAGADVYLRKDGELDDLFAAVRGDYEGLPRSH